jgi:hypothetical protein
MKIFVATYNHKYGTDVRAFRTSEGADKWRIEIANEEWRHVFRNKQKPDDKERMSQVYWDYMSDYGDEYLTIYQCEIED